MKPAWVIANPQAGGGQGARIIPELEKSLGARGLDFSVHVTDAPGHARALARAARSSAGRVLVAGGDGTIHEVAAGLLSADDPAQEGGKIPPLSVLPVGTGNDFFRMVRSTETIEDAVAALVEGVPRWFEVGEVTWGGGRHHFVNLLGVGIDVEVLRRRPAFGRLPGLLQYLASFASALTRFEPVPLRVVVGSGDGNSITLEGPALLSAVTVGPSVGGGFVLSPAATPDDGRLDLFHAEPLGLIKVLRYLPGILRGAGIQRPEISLCQGTNVHIERTDGVGLAFELDGELMEASTTPLVIQVRPASLPILEVPR